MHQPSARTCLLIGGGIATAVLGTDLVRFVTAGRLPPDRLRNTALAAAAVLTAVGLSSRHTRLTLDLARRVERARVAGTWIPAAAGTGGNGAGQVPALSTGTTAQPDGRR